MKCCLPKTDFFVNRPCSFFKAELLIMIAMALAIVALESVQSESDIVFVF